VTGVSIGGTLAIAAFDANFATDGTPKQRRDSSYVNLGSLISYANTATRSVTYFKGCRCRGQRPGRWRGVDANGFHHGKCRGLILRFTEVSLLKQARARHTATGNAQRPMCRE